VEEDKYQMRAPLIKRTPKQSTARGSFVLGNDRGVDADTISEVLDPQAVVEIFKIEEVALVKEAHIIDNPARDEHRGTGNVVYGEDGLGFVLPVGVSDHCSPAVVTTAPVIASLVVQNGGDDTYPFVLAKGCKELRNSTAGKLEVVVHKENVGYLFVNQGELDTLVDPASKAHIGAIIDELSLLDYFGEWSYVLFGVVDEDKAVACDFIF